MANEAVITDLLGNGGDPIQYTVLNANNILKGTVMELEDTRTVKTCSATDKPLAGIAAAEKVAADGTTTIAVITNCIAKMVCGAAGVTVGNEVVVETAPNLIKDADATDDETGDVLGYALETGTSGESVLVRVQK